MTMDCTPTTSAPTEASVWGHNSRFQCFSAPQDGTDDNTVISCKDVWLDVFWVAVRRDGRPLVPNLNINGSYPPSSALSSMTIRIFSLLSSPPRRTDYYYECDGRPPMAERTQREVTMREGDATSQRLSFTSNISRRADVSSAAAQWWRITLWEQTKRTSSVIFAAFLKSNYLLTYWSMNRDLQCERFWIRPSYWLIRAAMTTIFLVRR